jgi:hypothetical protein
VLAEVLGDGEVDAAVSRLIRSLGRAGHHVETVGTSGWRLWDGPE